MNVCSTTWIMTNSNDCKSHLIYAKTIMYNALIVSLASTREQLLKTEDSASCKVR